MRNRLIRELYTENYYRGAQANLKSAHMIIPLVLELLQPRKVNSVVDVGCGTGTWLTVFKQAHGVEEILGIDGQFSNGEMLDIPEESFLAFDLRNRLHLKRGFDLVLSLETVEHLPEQCSGLFVDSLTSLGPVVLFSAAIPFQAGANHLNLQWPEYWADMFLKRDYVVVDCLRKRLWRENQIKWWYAQNILLFVSRKCLHSYPRLQTELDNREPSNLSLVHPNHYLAITDPKNISLKRASRLLLTVIKQRLRQS